MGLPGPGGCVPWREAGPPNHHDDKVDSDQQVVNKELSLQIPAAWASLDPEVVATPEAEALAVNLAQVINYGPIVIN